MPSSPLNRFRREATLREIVKMRLLSASALLSISMSVRRTRTSSGVPVKSDIGVPNQS